MLVLLLAMLAAAPEVHEHLHPGVNHTDHACAIVLFAQGVSLTTGLHAEPPLAFEPTPSALPARPLLYLTAAHYLHPSGRGPPAC